MLPPFVMQTVAEAFTAGVAASMLPVMKADCLHAFRAIVCSSYLLSAQPKYELAALFGPVYLPRFPQRSVCTHYNDVCSVAIRYAPAFGVDCNATVPGSAIELYPSSTQVRF